MKVWSMFSDLFWFLGWIYEWLGAVFYCHILGIVDLNVVDWYTTFSNQRPDPNISSRRCWKAYVCHFWDCKCYFVLWGYRLLIQWIRSFPEHPCSKPASLKTFTTNSTLSSGIIARQFKWDDKSMSKCKTTWSVRQESWEFGITAPPICIRSDRYVLRPSNIKSPARLMRQLGGTAE